MILIDYIKVSTYARIINKSSTWIYKMIEEGKLKPKAVKIDGVVFVHKNAEIIK